MNTKAETLMAPALALDLDVQWAVASVPAPVPLPDEGRLRQWACAALQELSGPVEVTVRIVDEDESAQLNFTYRGRAGATNILSFPFEVPAGIDSALLGDLVICAPVVAREAEVQHKTLFSHWAHMVVHGCLHLQGYDHQTDVEAEAMEALEARILATLGFENPYSDN